MLRKDMDELTDVGDWYFMKEDTYIVFRYGSEWQDVAVIPITNNPLPNNQCWHWDGNKEAPTITPSVRVMGAEGKPDVWHGYLREGKLVLA